MVDVRQELFGDWCELNFKDGISGSAMADVQLDYAHIDAISQAQSAAVAKRAGIADSRAVTFIPSVIAESSSFWNGVIDKSIHT